MDRVPLEFLYPPTEWQPGRLIVDQYELLLPSDLPAGKYQLVFGGYDDNGRLVWEDGQDVQEMAEVLVQP